MAEAEAYDSYALERRPPRVTPINQATSVRNRPQTYPPGPNQCAEIDTYDLDDPSYDRDAWYTAASGSDRQSEVISLRIPRYMANVLDEMCARRAFPAMKTKADFFRSAGVHYLYYLISRMRDVDFHIEVSAHTHLQKVTAMLDEFDAKRKMVQNYRELLEEAEGDPYTTRRALDLLWDAMESGQYYGKVLAEMEELSEEYGKGYFGPRSVDLTD